LCSFGKLNAPKDHQKAVETKVWIYLDKVTLTDLNFRGDINNHFQSNKCSYSIPNQRFELCKNCISSTFYCKKAAGKIPTAAILYILFCLLQQSGQKYLK
jgi:hypothetical protein